MMISDFLYLATGVILVITLASLTVASIVSLFGKRRSRRPSAANDNSIPFPLSR